MPDRIVEVFAGANTVPVIGILKPQGTVAVVSLQMLIVCPCQRLAAIRERVAGFVIGDSFSGSGIRRLFNNITKQPALLAYQRDNFGT